MQISSNKNTPQFSGAFLINYNKALPGVREGLENVIGLHKRQIYDNFNGKKNHVMYVMKNSKDFDVADFVVRNEVNFRYYPDVDTKLRFDIDKPQDVIEYLKKNRPKILQKPHELLEFMTKNREFCRKRENSHLSAVDMILQSLKFDGKSGQKLKHSQGYTVFTDNETKNKVVVSPKTQKGTRYVFVNPCKSYEDVKRYAFDEKGNMLRTFGTPDGIRLFNDLFRKAISGK